MNKKSLLPALGCFALAAVMIIFARGPRRIYTGIFFIILGIVLLSNTVLRRNRGGEK